MDSDLQNQLVKDGEVQRQKIDNDVEKLLEAAMKGDVNGVTKILKEKEANKDFIDEIDANKRTALHFAVHGDNVEIIKILLEKKANINAQDWEECTPLMHGLKANKEKASLFLIENGAALDTVTEKGLTALHCAVIGQNLKLVQTLVEKGVKSLSKKTNESGSVLHHAITGSEEIAELVIKNEPELVNSVDANNMVPLHLACAYNNTKMALLLIERGTDVNRASTDGTTALHIATDAGNIAIVKSLVTKGAVQKMDASGYTPIMSASKAEGGSAKILEDLLKDLKVDYTPVAQPTTAAKPNTPKLSAETLKENGNKAFGKKDYDMALHWYNLAIDVDSIYCEIENRPSSIGHILFSNRSITHLHMKSFTDALNDADNAINLAPSWPKGYLRKGAALEALGRADEAKACYEKQSELENKPSTN